MTSRPRHGTQRHTTPRRRLWARLIGVCLAGGIVVAAAFAPITIAGGLLIDRVSVTADPVSAQLAGKPLSETGAPLVTTVLDRTGSPIAQLFDQYRLPVTYRQIAPAMTAAIVAVEDRRFFQSAGVDPLAVVRALLHDGSGGSVQGASTITQQYVKNYLINVVDRNNPAAQQADRADTIARKVREAEAALQVSAATPKTDILAGYLNLIEFTGNIYGVRAAAHAYFDTTPDRLTVPQAALLAGMVNNPNLYDPYTHPQQARARRDVAIDAMVTNGSLTAGQGAAAKAAPLGIIAAGPLIPGSTCMSAAPEAGFFCDYAVRYAENAGLSADQIATGGYTIRTTMDPAAAAAAKSAVDRNVPPTQDGVANTFALIAPGTSSHQVLAMVANRSLGNDASLGQTATNIVADPSNVFGAGSSFKIFTTAAALENGTIGFDSTLPNPPSDCFRVPNANRYTSCYPVANDGTHYPDPISLQAALATSPNVAFVGLESQVGLPAVLQMAQRLGLRDTLASNDVGRAPITDPANPLSRDPQYNEPQSGYFRNLLSFTLGASPVSPLEMANVIATIKSGGTWCPPDPILSITDRDGRPVHLTTQPCEQVVAPGLADTLAAGLSQDTTVGTSAAAAAAAGWTRPDIGKTGTTSQSESVTFVGGVNQYAASSMVFADGPHPQELCPGQPVHLGTCGNGAFGGTVAAPPYFQAMQEILGSQPDQPTPPPDPGFLSAGNRAPVIPYTVGKTESDARSALQAAHDPVTVDRLTSSGPPGAVLAQTPQGNAPAGAAVTLYISAPVHP
jgi:membrane peptidoglycan carboxypeptidase